LNEGGTGRAFYCVHSVGGDVMSFRHLARLMADQPFFGIQAPPEIRNGEFPSSIEAMAHHYVKALLAFQPEGPYLLGGWSAGSIIALEMAHQLRATGHEVSLLVALDGAPFNTGAGTKPWNPLYYLKLLRNLPRWIGDDLMVDFSLDVFTRRVRNKLISLGKKTSSALKQDAKVHGHEVEGFLDTSYYSDSQVSFMKSLFVASRAYMAKEYTGRVLLYAAQTQPLYHLLEVELPWGKIAPRLVVIPARGTHESIVREPHVRPIADDLRIRLAEFRRNPPATESPNESQDLISARIETV
jgi:thioesterase domain-containing protein